MKRRKFIGNVGLGIGSGLIAPKSLAIEPKIEVYEYPGICSLADATNSMGELALRCAFKNTGLQSRGIKVGLEVSGKAKESRRKWYFLESPEQLTPNSSASAIELDPTDTDVLVIWLNDATEECKISISFANNKLRFALGELLKKGYTGIEGPISLSVNLLGYSELGNLDPSTLGIKNNENFRFAIIADPQGGDAYKPYNGVPTRIKIHNAFFEDTVQCLNALEPLPLATLVLGDFVDDQGEEGHFKKMEELIAPLKMPILLAVGNHETAYKADFTPGYNMKALNNFFASQNRINGTKKIVYSFNLGKWHFIVWPDPLRSNFWENHPHYFDWLEKDLEQHKSWPVIFLHHVPIHPIGIDPLTSYVESVSVRRLLLNVLATYGNVKYVFSGHVHIPLKASLKTAVNYKGMKMINLPPAGFRARAFGEQDFFGGPEQGACILEIKGDSLHVNFQTVSGEGFTYPEDFRAFDDKTHALWFNQTWQLPLNKTIKNGDFSNGLEFWHQRFVYQEDKNPSNIREIRLAPDGKPALYLYSRKRGYDAPGQDRLPQHINRLAQAVAIKGMTQPVFQFSFMLEKERYDPESLNGFFLWMECYSDTRNVANLVYSAGKVYGGLTRGFGKSRNVGVLHFDLPCQVGEWQVMALSLNEDFNSANEDDIVFNDLSVDRILISLGTWTINEGMGQEAGVYLRNLALDEGDANAFHTAIKKKEDIWHLKLNHVAGDHQYTKQAEVYPKGLRGW